MKVAMFYDIEGWAWWHRIKNIKLYIDRDVTIDAIKIGTDFNHNDYDLVVIFEARYVSAATNTPPSKLIIGCSCPVLLPELKESIDYINPLGVVVNNFQMWQIAQNWSNCYNCPNGVNTDTFYPSGFSDKSELAIWIGNSNALVDKGFELIKKACQKASYPLMCVELNELIRENGLLSHDELRDQVYHRATVLICASEAEGTPNPALEALACGVPVISTRVGNMPEIIKNSYNGFLVERSVGDILSALNDLRNSNFSRMSGHAFNSVFPKWSWSEKSKNYHYMFHNLLSGRM